MIALHRRTATEIRCRRSARHDENPTESGGLFAFALVIAVGLIIFTGMAA